MLFHSLAILNAPVFEYKTPEANSTNAGLIQDIVATLRIDCVSQAQVERARNGAAGWCTAEILRADAETLLAQNDISEERRDGKVVAVRVDLGGRRLFNKKDTSHR